MIGAALELAQTSDPASWTQTVRDIGILGVVLIGGWAFYTRRVVLGNDHRERLAEERERTAAERARGDEWKRIALERALPLTEQAVEAARR